MKPQDQGARLQAYRERDDVRLAVNLPVAFLQKAIDSWGRGSVSQLANACVTLSHGSRRLCPSETRPSTGRLSRRS
jgi:hypothetical protein